jgi:hypothetical protein
VVQSLREVWLLKIAPEDWRPPNGEHMVEIGPLSVLPAKKYEAPCLEGIEP